MHVQGKNMYCYSSYIDKLVVYPNIDSFRLFGRLFLWHHLLPVFLFLMGSWRGRLTFPNYRFVARRGLGGFMGFWYFFLRVSFSSRFLFVCFLLFLLSLFLLDFLL